MDWFVSDTHFNHNNIIAFGERPFHSYVEMNKTMIENWNKRVKPGDTVYHLGDFGLHNRVLIEEGWGLERIFNSLNGDKILIKGNHDKGPVKKLPWKEIHDDLIIRNDLGNFLLTHKPTVLREFNGVILCGHIHQQFIYQGNNLNMSVEVWGYQPVTLEEIKNRITFLRDNVFDTNTKMLLFGKEHGFSRELKVPIP